jgi:HEAT repeats
MTVDTNRIKSELGKVGICVNNIYELVNIKKPYPLAIPVLIDLIKEDFEDIREKEGVVRALAVKEAIGMAGPVLISEYNRTPKELIFYRWAIGNTVYSIITENDIESILQIVQNKENGMSRQMFVAALGKVGSGKVEEVLIKLLDDEEVIPHALEALGRLKSKRAKEKISTLILHPKSLIKKEAQKALKKIS